MNSGCGRKVKKILKEKRIDKSWRFKEDELTGRLERSARINKVGRCGRLAWHRLSGSLSSLIPMLLT